MGHDDINKMADEMVRRAREAAEQDRAEAQHRAAAGRRRNENLKRCNTQARELIRKLYHALHREGRRGAEAFERQTRGLFGLKLTKSRGWVIMPYSDTTAGRRHMPYDGFEDYTAEIKRVILGEDGMLYVNLDHKGPEQFSYRPLSNDEALIVDEAYLDVLRQGVAEVLATEGIRMI